MIGVLAVALLVRGSCSLALTKGASTKSSGHATSTPPRRPPPAPAAAAAHPLPPPEPGPTQAGTAALMTKLVLEAFARLDADSQLKVSDFAFEDPASIIKVRWVGGEVGG